MKEERPLEPLLRAAKGGKRRRAVLIITFALVLYLARQAPEQLMAHLFEVLEILLIATLVDVVQESTENARRIEEKRDSKELEAVDDESKV